MMIQTPSETFVYVKSLISNAFVCLFQCQPTALLRALGSAQVRKMALSVFYFRIMHRLGRPHYEWDEYLNSVL